MPDVLTWDDSFAIAKALIQKYPNLSLENISLQDIYTWTLELHDFSDEPQLANDGILMAIYQEWFEEVNAV